MGDVIDWEDPDYPRDLEDEIGRLEVENRELKKRIADALAIIKEEMDREQ